MNRIQELRTELGWRQEDLAKQLNITRQAVANHESGRRSLNPDTIQSLCEIFHVTADYLLGFSSQRNFSVSDEDAEVIDAYHAAPENVRSGIDALLSPYRKNARVVDDFSHEPWLGGVRRAEGE